MRIMLIVNEFPPEKIAGTAMATQALAAHLSAHGHRVLVVVTTPCPPALLNNIESADYDLVWMQARRFRGMGMLLRIWQAWRVARHFRPQVIQGQAVSCGLIAAVIGKLLHIPSICYAQGYDIYEASPWQQHTEIRWGCRWSDRLLAVTQHLADRIKSVTGATQVELMPHAFILPESIPDRDAARKVLNIRHAQRIVFCIGRLETFKGHDVLLRAWQGFSTQHPEASLQIAGTGSQLEPLQQQSLTLGIDRSVNFIGQLSAGKVHQWMATADLFVLPSRSEPFGIVLLEAMAHGLPVVASDVGGIPEVVPATGDVRLVPVDHVEALQQAMLDMFSRGFTVSEINRQHTLRFRWHLQVARFESIYEQLRKK